MAGSATADLPCQVTEDAKMMAILLACPSGEDSPEGRRRHPRRQAQTSIGAPFSETSVSTSPDTFSTIDGDAVRWKSTFVRWMAPTGLSG